MSITTAKAMIIHQGTTVSVLALLEKGRWRVETAKHLRVEIKEISGGQGGLTETCPNQAGETGEDEEVQRPGHTVGEGDDPLEPVDTRRLKHHEIITRCAECPPPPLREVHRPGVWHIGKRPSSQRLPCSRFGTGREHETDVIPVLAGGGANLFQDIVRRGGAVSEQFNENVIATRRFADA